jgi:hypothetical protein
MFQNSNLPSSIEGGHQNGCQTGAYQRNEHPTKNDALQMDGAAARTVTYESRNILKSGLHRLYATDETEEIPDLTNIAGKCMAEMMDAAPNNEQLQRYRKESGWTSPAKVVGRINRSVRIYGSRPPITQEVQPLGHLVPTDTDNLCFNHGRF